MNRPAGLCVLAQYCQVREEAGSFEPLSEWLRRARQAGVHATVELIPVVHLPTMVHRTHAGKWMIAALEAQGFVLVGSSGDTLLYRKREP